MRLGEEDLGERFFFLIGTEVKPLESAVDVREGKKTVLAPVTQPFLDGLVGDNARNKRGAALDDIVLWFASFQPFFDRGA